jgi:hypothetical protein
MKKYGLCAILVACLNCDDAPTSSQGGDLPPDTFVNGSEGQVWWPSPFTPYYSRTQGQFRAGTAWMNFIDDQRIQDGSRVEIDYLRMYARVNGNDQLVSSDEYDDGVVGGGLYFRSPWFSGSQRATNASRATFSNGTVSLPLETCPDCVWHVWVEDYPRPPIPTNASKVWVEARFRLVGTAVAQLGWDYYRNESDIGCDIDLNGTQDPGFCEAGKSYWTFPTSNNGGWQILSLGK